MDMELRAAFIEWVWVAAGFCGLIVNVTLFRAVSVAQELLHAETDATHAETIIANAAVRQEAIRVAKQSVIFVGGVASLFIAPPPPDVTDLPQTIVGITTIVMVSTLMAVTSFIERRARRLVRDDIRQRRPYVRTNGTVTTGTRATDRRMP